MTLATYKKYAIIGLASVVGLFLFGVIAKAAWHEATKERPHFSSGKVIERDFTPAHTEMIPQQQYVGETCSSYSNADGSSYRSCSPNYITIMVPNHVPDDWDVRIENCNVFHKDGTQWANKDGSAKCFKKWIDVDESTYNRYAVGGMYP